MCNINSNVNNRYASDEYKYMTICWGKGAGREGWQHFMKVIVEEKSCLCRASKVCFHNHIDFSIISHTVVPIGVLVVHIRRLNITFVFLYAWILHSAAVAFLFFIFLCAAAAIFNLFQSGFQRKVVVSLNQAVSGTTVVTVRQDQRIWLEKKSLAGRHLTYTETYSFKNARANSY